MIITQKYKDKYLKEIASLIGSSPVSSGADLSDLSSRLKRELRSMLPVLEVLIRDGLISVHVRSGLHKIKSATDNPEMQIKMLHNALVAPAELIDVLYIKDNTTVTISINQSKPK
jgi:hypothetical protein